MKVATRQKDTVSSLVVKTTQGGIAIGAIYGGAALDAFGIGWIAIAAAVPLALSLAVLTVSRSRGLITG